MGGNMVYNGEGIKHDDVYASLEHYGYPLISHIPLKGGKILPIENLILEILEKTIEVREIEGIPLILSKNNFSSETLTTDAIRRRLAGKTGYICELTLDIVSECNLLKNKEDLTKTTEILFSYKEMEDASLVNNLPEKLIEEFRHNDNLGKKWGVVGCVDYSSVKRILEKRQY